MSDISAVYAVRSHPAIRELGRTAGEQERLRQFAHDLAAWLYSGDRQNLGPLARVITVVAARELRDARRLCRDRALLSVEAAARAAAALWPLLRGPEEPPKPDEETEAPPSTEGEPSASGAGPGEGEGAGDQEITQADGGASDGSEGDEASPPTGESTPSEGAAAHGAAAQDPADVLAALAELEDGWDPELDSLAEKLRELASTQIETDAGELLSDAAQAATDAAIQTDQVTRHLEQFLPGIGWSSAAGSLESSLLTRLDELTHFLTHFEDLKALADALGRLKEPSKDRGKLQGGREDLVGVTLGGEVSLALPCELALLADPDTEDLFYQRYVERRLISLELTGEATDGSAAGSKKGPVIACIDTSASMEGPPEIAAKALVLAVCKRVLPQRRTVHLILFGGEGERTEIRLRFGRGNLERLLSFLAASFLSGTDFDGPLLRAMDLLEERDLHRADVLVVTDGLCRATPEVIDRVNQIRASKGARVWSVVLGRSSARGVEPFSDEVFQLDPTSAARETGLLRRL